MKHTFDISQVPTAELRVALAAHRSQMSDEAVGIIEGELEWRTTQEEICQYLAYARARIKQREG
jgi:hypothetical protein